MIPGHHFANLEKNMGDKVDPDNNRGIIILRCFSKLSTTVLNKRLNKHLDNMNLLCDEQAEF